MKHFSLELEKKNSQNKTIKVKSENRKTSYSLTAFGHKKFSPRGGHTMDNSHNGFMRNALELFGKMMEFRSVLSPTKIIFDECHDIRHDQNSKIEMAAADAVFLLKLFYKLFFKGFKH